jgi:hypothetical protein
VPYSGLTGTVPTWNQSTTGNAAGLASNPILSGTITNSTWSGGSGGVLTTNTFGQFGYSQYLPVALGGTGTATPSLVSGTNVTISGSWPNQTVSSTSFMPLGFGGSVSGTLTTTSNQLTISNPSYQQFQINDGSGDYISNFVANYGAFYYSSQPFDFEPNGSSVIAFQITSTGDYFSPLIVPATSNACSNVAGWPTLDWSGTAGGEQTVLMQACPNVLTGTPTYLTFSINDEINIVSLPEIVNWTGHFQQTLATFQGLTGVPEGSQGYDTTHHEWAYYNGTVWLDGPNVQVGQVTSSSGTVTTAHTFSTAFTATPNCVASPLSNAGAWYFSTVPTTSSTGIITYATSGAQTFNVQCTGPGGVW